MHGVHSGFNLHRSRRVRRDKRDDLGRLAQYIILNPYVKKDSFIMPKPLPEPAEPKPVKGWPFSAEDAVGKQGSTPTVNLDLGDGVSIALAWIPGGRFLMGSNDETPVERPVSEVAVKKYVRQNHGESFWP